LKLKFCSKFGFVKGWKPRGAQGFAFCGVRARTSRLCLPTEELVSRTTPALLAVGKVQIADMLRAIANAISFVVVFRVFMIFFFCVDPT